MQTEVKEMEINGCHYHYYEGYLESILKEIETLGVNQQCSLHLCNFIYERQETKKIFETVFVK